MIRLEVSDYCQTCSHFEPDVEKHHIEYYSLKQKTDTVIRCESRDRCDLIMRYLETWKEVNNG